MSIATAEPLSSLGLFTTFTFLVLTALLFVLYSTLLISYPLPSLQFPPPPPPLETVTTNQPTTPHNSKVVYIYTGFFFSLLFGVFCVFLYLWCLEGLNFPFNHYPPPLHKERNKIKAWHHHQRI
jgi:magnesium-transporting ATPase (P-type)